MPVRYVSSFPALVYDPEHKRVVRVVISVDDQGRRWESYDGRPDYLIDSPNEPTKVNRKAPGTSGNK